MTKSQKAAILGLCLLSTFAMSAAGGSPAFAAHNPEFRWCQEAKEGKFENSECTKAGGGKWEVFGHLTTESEGLEAEASSTQKFKIEEGGKKFTISCKALKLNEGKVSGGEFEAEKLGGTSEGKLAYEECEVEGSPHCDINEGESGKGRFETELLFSSLAFATKEAAEKEKLEIKEESQALLWLRPKIVKAEGEQVFAKRISLTPAADCPLGEVDFVTFQHKEGSDSEPGLELTAPEAHAISREVEFSSKRVFWTNEKGAPTERKTSGLKTGGGGTVGYEGKITFKLTSKARWWEEA
jgi:hypothetical protein